MSLELDCIFITCGFGDPELAITAWTLVRSSRLILFVADLFHPVDCLAIEPFLDGEVRHRGGRRRAVPMLLARRDPDHVTGTDVLDRTAPALCLAGAGGHDESLPERVGVPRGSSPRLERDARA